MEYNIWNIPRTKEEEREFKRIMEMDEREHRRRYAHWSRQHDAPIFLENPTLQQQFDRIDTNPGRGSAVREQEHLKLLADAVEINQKKEKKAEADALNTAFLARQAEAELAVAATAARSAAKKAAKKKAKKATGEGPYKSTGSGTYYLRSRESPKRVWRAWKGGK